MAKQRLVILLLITVQLNWTIAAPLEANFDGSDEFDSVGSSEYTNDKLLAIDDPRIEVGLGPMDLQQRAKRKEQTDQRLAMFLAFNGDGRNHFVHTQTCPKHHKREKDSKRRHRYNHKKESTEDSITRTIGQLLIDALKSKEKCKRNKPIPKDEESINEIGYEEKEIIDDYLEDIEQKIDDDEVLLDKDDKQEIIDDDLDDDLPEDYESGKIPESGELQIHGDNPEKEPRTKCTHQHHLPTTTEHIPTTTHKPPTTFEPPVTCTHPEYHSTTTASPCTNPEHVIDGSMSHSHIQSLLKRLLGLHCSCEPSDRRKTNPTKPIVIIEDSHRSPRKTTPDMTTAAPVKVTTEEIIEHVIHPRPNPKLRQPFQHLLKPIDDETDSHEHFIVKHRKIGKKKVENTINMIVPANDATKQRPHGSSRKPHRSSKPIANTSPSNELHIILDQEDNDINGSDDEEVFDVGVEETKISDEETDIDNEDHFDGQESRHELQFFRDHRSRLSKAAAPKTGEPPRNWRTGGRRKRRRGVAKSSDVSDRKDSLRPEDRVDITDVQKNRSQRGAERETTSATAATERRGSSDSWASGDAAASENSLYRASLPVGLKDSTKTRLGFKSAPIDPPREELTIKTADLLLKQFLYLYDQFKHTVGGETDEKSNDY